MYVCPRLSSSYIFCDASFISCRFLQLLIALASNHGRLLNFLKTRSVPAQSQHSTTFHLTMFDTIEANDNATISWEAFLRYFGGSKDLGEGAGMSSDAERMNHNHPGKAGRGGKFVLEQCTCEKEDTWIERWRGIIGEATVKVRHFKAHQVPFL